MKEKLRKLLLFIIRPVTFLVINFLNLTTRYKIVGLDKPYPHAIYAFWHRDIIPLLVNRRFEHIAVIISPSRDGDFIAAPAKGAGYIPVRGSSSRKGSEALKRMVDLSVKHKLAITPDGPRGPAQIAKDGVFQLAYLTKLPIYCVNVHKSNAWRFNSWDKLVFPKPFSKVTITYSDPIIVESKEQFDEYKVILEEFLNREF